MPLDPSRRAALNLAKLKVLAASAGADALTPLGFPGGAAASGDGTLWVLGDEKGVELLGAALTLAVRDDDAPERLVVIHDDPTVAGVIARRAEYFATPASIEVRRVEGTSLAFCEGFPVPNTDKPSQNEVVAPSGVDVVHEHGVTSFEVRGLEIGRIENGEIAVGVGKHDREAHRMANSNATLDDLARRVANERRAGAPSGAMTSIGRERWLRSIVVQKPEILGLGRLTPVAPPLPRQDLRQAGVAPAVGAKDGRSVIVACSVGVDPDLVPSAADARAMHAPDADLVLVVPEADALPSMYRVADALERPARVVTVPDNWASLGD